MGYRKFEACKRCQKNGDYLLLLQNPIYLFSRTHILKYLHAELFDWISPESNVRTIKSQWIQTKIHTQTQIHPFTCIHIDSHMPNRQKIYSALRCKHIIRHSLNCWMKFIDQKETAVAPEKKYDAPCVFVCDFGWCSVVRVKNGPSVQHTNERCGNASERKLVVRSLCHGLSPAFGLSRSHTQTPTPPAFLSHPILLLLQFFFVRVQSAEHLVCSKVLTLICK